MTVYKLTTAKGKTRPGKSNKTQWGRGVEHSAPGGGALCTSAYVHAYSDPLLAIMMDPAHGAYGSAALLWECDADVEIDDGTKLGCTRVKTVRAIGKPVVTLEQRVRFGILCALGVCDLPAFVTWAGQWLNGKDRSAHAAHYAASAAPPADHYAARAAAYAAAHADAHQAAHYAARAADQAHHPIDYVAIAKQAVKEETPDNA